MSLKSISALLFLASFVFAAPLPQIPALPNLGSLPVSGIASLAGVPSIDPSPVDLGRTVTSQLIKSKDVSGIPILNNLPGTGSIPGLRSVPGLSSIGGMVRKQVNPVPNIPITGFPIPLPNQPVPEDQLLPVGNLPHSPQVPPPFGGLTPSFPIPLPLPLPLPISLPLPFDNPLNQRTELEVPNTPIPVNNALNVPNTPADAPDVAIASNLGKGSLPNLPISIVEDLPLGDLPSNNPLAGLKETRSKLARRQLQIIDHSGRNPMAGLQGTNFPRRQLRINDLTGMTGTGGGDNPLAGLKGTNFSRRQVQINDHTILPSSDISESSLPIIPDVNNVADGAVDSHSDVDAAGSPPIVGNGIGLPSPSGPPTQAGGLVRRDRDLGTTSKLPIPVPIVGDILSGLPVPIIGGGVGGGLRARDLDELEKLVNTLKNLV